MTNFRCKHNYLVSFWFGSVELAYVRYRLKWGKGGRDGGHTERKKRERNRESRRVNTMVNTYEDVNMFLFVCLVS